MIASPLLPPDVVHGEQEGDWILDSTLQMERAARRLDLEDWIVQRLKHPEREMTVNLILLREGDALPYCGFRVQHSLACGPCMGPIVVSPDVHLQRLRALAAAMTWQWALLGLPLGGSAGALVCDPRSLSELELQSLAKEYLVRMGDFVGPGADVVTADTEPQILGWMLDAWRRAHLRGDAPLAGKPPALGGAAWLAAVAAAGLVALAAAALAERKPILASARVAIQGFSPIMSAASRQLSEAGARIVAVADASGGLFSHAGLDLAAVQSYAARHEVLFGYPEAEAVSNAEVLQAPCDLLITAGGEGQINRRNADRIAASVIIEAAYGGISTAGESVLLSRDRSVICDLLGCAGKPLACFLEWRYGALLDSAEAEPMLRQRIARAYKTVRDAAGDLQLSFRQSAYRLAVERVGAALRALGQ